MQKPKKTILAERVDELLKKHGLSAHAASLKAGQHHEAIRNIGRGNMPSAERLDALAKLFGVTSAYLLGTTDDPTQIHTDLTDNVVTLPNNILDRDLLQALTMALLDAVAPTLRDKAGMADRFIHFYDLAIKSEVQSPHEEYATMIKHLVVGQK
jgi:transcriptional regulator with XRE-family HTH domain